MKRLLTLAASVLFVTSVESTTIHVPSDQPNLQAAVDSCVSGDTILVAAGTYSGTGNYNVDFGARNLIVRSESGRDSTIIDCADSSVTIRRGFILEQDQDSTTVVDGFTFRNATIGVFIMGSPLIRNSKLDSNGIGLYAQGKPDLDSLVIRDNDTGISAEMNSLLWFHELSIRNNLSGVSLLNSSAAVHQCELDSNSTGVTILNGTLSIVDVDFHHNDTAISGAIGPGSTPITGLRCNFIGNDIGIRGECTLTSSLMDSGSVGLESSFPDEVLATDCQFSNLTSVVVKQFIAPKVKSERDRQAAAPNFVEPGATFIRCTFENNAGNVAYIHSGSDGDVSGLVLDSCTVRNNGGGIDVYGTLDMASSLYAQNGRGIRYLVHKDVLSTHKIRNTTIAANADTGLSVNSFQYLPLIIESSLIAFNDGAGLAYQENDTSGTTKVTCSDVFGNSNGNYAYMPDQSDTNGNFSLNPFFCNPDSSDFTLKDISPCLPMYNACSTLVGSYNQACIDEPPLITSSDSVNVLEDSLLMYRVSFIDSDGPDTVLSVSDYPSWLTVDADSIFGTPVNNTPDTSFVISVSDGYKADTLTVFVHVVPVNNRPSMAPISPKELYEGTIIDLVIVASDIDGDTLSLSALNLPVNAQFIDSGDNRGYFSYAPDFQASGDYVISFVADDGISSDTLPVSITVLDGDPSITNVSTPEEPDSLHLISDNPLFRWSYHDPTGVYPSDAYRITVLHDSAEIVDTLWYSDSVASELDSARYDGAVMPDGELFRVTIQAFNGAIWSPWYEASIRTNALPAVPVPLSPIDESPVFTQPVVYILNSSDPDSDLVSYDFELYADSLLTNRLAFVEQIGESPDSTGWTITDSLPDNSFYYWHVRAFDGLEYSIWSPAVAFWLDATAQPPSAPIPITPADTLPTTYTLLPQLTWNRSTDPDIGDSILYRMDLSIDSSFTFVHTRDSLKDTSVVIEDSLTLGTRYWWKVRATDRTGLFAESEVKSFRTWVSGDVNHDGAFDISDVVYIVEYSFANGPAVEPPLVGDVDGSCGLDIADLVYMVEFAFASGPAPVAGCAE